MTAEDPGSDPARAFDIAGLEFDLEALRSVSPLQHAARRTADAVRRLIAGLETTTASEEQLDALTVAIDGLRTELPVRAQGVPVRTDDPTVVYQGHRLRERSPFIGRANPIALPLVLEFSEAGVEARPTFGTLHEGPPGCLHGGCIAGMFDEALGAVQTYAGQSGMTGRLTVHYRSPTPLHVELHLRAWLESVKGRKIVCKGTLHAGDRLCAEADGLFVAVDPRTMFAEAERRAAERAAEGG